MEQSNNHYYKAALLVAFLILISFSINSVIINPFETLPYFFRLLFALLGTLSVIFLFKVRKELALLDGLTFLKYCVCFIIAISFFSGVITVFNPQLKGFIVERKYDDYYVRIKDEDHYQLLYYHFAVARQRNNVTFLVNFEKNNDMDTFIYLDASGLTALHNIMETTKDKNLIALYDKMNKDGKINLKESKQLLSFIEKIGVNYEKTTF